MSTLPPRLSKLPCGAVVYLTSTGWRVQSGRGVKSPSYPTRRDALRWLQRQRNREQYPEVSACV